MDHQGTKRFVPVETGAPRYGSDLIAAAIREQGFPYICLNPGASYRHLHDSLVNYLGNEKPKILLCMHEEHAIGIAQGWAKITDRPLAAAVHSNVGLMHATMGIFDAWCDRVPVVVIGATGPLDATKRRPWIEWIHCTIDQGGLVRDFTKWDDEPASPEAAVESIRRATMLATARPSGPTYINLDVTVQEMELEKVPTLHDISRFRAPADPDPPRRELEEAIEILAKAKRPVILSGRTSRSEEGWAERVKLAELLEAKVLTHVKLATSFPTTHPLFVGETGWKLSKNLLKHLNEADAVLSLDWLDLAGTINQVFPAGGTSAPIISVSNDFNIHRGWNMDYQGLPAVDVNIPTVPETAVSRLLEALETRLPAPRTHERRRLDAEPSRTSGPISLMDLARVFNRVTRDRDVCLTSRPLGWPTNANELEHPHDYLGHNGGGGVGSGPSIGIGAALALRDMKSARVPIAIVGDGDFTMGNTALWSAASQGIPLLYVISNNNSYFNDEHHQAQVAVERGRPPENAWVGQRLQDPVPDLLMLAKAQGIDGEGPITDIAELSGALQRGIEKVKSGKPWVIDVRVPPEYCRDPMVELA
ncbi:thiamine pyrophosphate-binding protein [Sinorhizobium fredii]|uniref:thiamine pyrophosphate-binding protein n=1 Tax=Rhizobium fredii TaxID=380 RepID=UPI00059572D5|nr:thiamine pyrophosphate-binding protein [Sinorhizobium fredii]WOS65635.1 thiamine pyrophosphate-binding protein [Sinorhizobium fredii GR64]